MLGWPSAFYPHRLAYGRHHEPLVAIVLPDDPMVHGAVERQREREDGRHGLAPLIDLRDRDLDAGEVQGTAASVGAPAAEVEAIEHPGKEAVPRAHFHPPIVDSS